MSRESFDAITENIFEPEDEERQITTARWFDIGLNHRFSMLEIGSGVTERGLELYDERKKNYDDYQAMDIRYRENPFGDDPHWLLMETTRLQVESQQSTTRWAIFCALYTTVQEEIIAVPARETVDYDAVISLSCGKRIAEIERDPYRQQILKDDLCSLINDLGMLYRLEAGQHFNKLIHDHSSF